MSTFFAWVGGFFILCAAVCWAGERISEMLHQRRLRMKEARAMRLCPGGEGVFDQEFVKKWEQEQALEADFQLFASEAENSDAVDSAVEWLMVYSDEAWRRRAA